MDMGCRRSSSSPFPAVRSQKTLAFYESELEFVEAGIIRAQPWGWWTGPKLEILEDYLQAFTTASK